MQPDKERRPHMVVAKVLILLFVALLMAPLTARRASAHKVNVFAWVEGHTVFVEGYFSGGKKAQNSLVEVYNGAGEKLLEGRTNEKGEFSFKIPKKTDLKIVLTASMGHKNDFIIPATDIRKMASASSGTSSEDLERSAVSVALIKDVCQLETMIEETMDRKLAPVIQLIRDTRKQGPTITEIIGGIGYIFGLFGVAIYVRNIKKRKQ